MANTTLYIGSKYSCPSFVRSSVVNYLTDRLTKKIITNPYSENLWELYAAEQSWTTKYYRN